METKKQILDDEPQRVYIYAGKRVTETEFNDIQKEVAKLDKVAKRLQELNNLPPEEYAKHSGEINALHYKKQNCEYWINYTLTHGKYQNRNIERR